MVLAKTAHGVPRAMQTAATRAVLVAKERVTVIKMRIVRDLLSADKTIAGGALTQTKFGMTVVKNHLLQLQVNQLHCRKP